MNLKVNNCGECEYIGEDEVGGESFFCCDHPKAWAISIVNIYKIPDNCPLKTSPITIKIEEK